MRAVSCSALGSTLVAATALTAACGEDLGTCEMDLATQVVYSSDGTPFYAGQGLVQFGCAEGVCHAAVAEGEGRKGAPHGLNFDVRPLTAQSPADHLTALSDGLAKVRDEGGVMWGEISAGTMPPGEAGKRPEQNWKLSNGNPAGLPGLSTGTGKETVRNWLACGAPVVAGVTGASEEAKTLGTVLDPLAIMTDPTGNGPTFDTVFDAVFSACSACHAPNGPYAALGLDLSSKDAAYSTLVDQPAFAGGSPGVCGDQTTKLVVPGSCEESLVYIKLRPSPPCGAQMPLGAPLSDDKIQALCDWIDAGANK